MLRLILVISLFLSGNLFANSILNKVLKEKQYQEVNKLGAIALNLTCSTELPTTSIFVKSFDDRVILRILHHNGLNFAPIHSGVITLNDIPFIEKKGSLFTKMGEHIVLEFELSRCKKHQEGNYSCYNSTPTTINELEVKSFGFQTYKSTSELYGMSFENLIFRLNLTVGNRSLSSSIEYSLPGDCILR
jgi:hypothetical protein